jgi:hypothetical protein
VFNVSRDVSDRATRRRLGLQGRRRVLGPTHAAALAAAGRAAHEQRVPGQTHVIEYEDAAGNWHTETASGSDRPETEVKDGRG